MWLQNNVRSKAVTLRKVKGTENPADIFTKHMSNAQQVDELMKQVIEKNKLADAREEEVAAREADVLKEKVRRCFV